MKELILSLTVAWTTRHRREGRVREKEKTTKHNCHGGQDTLSLVSERLHKGAGALPSGARTLNIKQRSTERIK